MDGPQNTIDPFQTGETHMYIMADLHVLTDHDVAMPDAEGRMFGE